MKEPTHREISSKGGNASAKKLTPEQRRARSERAWKAWQKKAEERRNNKRI